MFTLGIITFHCEILSNSVHCSVYEFFPYTYLFHSFSLVQFSSVIQLCLTLPPHEPQHARPPCPSPTPGIYPNSCPLSWWCHPTISSSVIHSTSYLQSSPASGSLPVSQFFTSGGKSIGVSPSASVPPMIIQDWFSSGLTGWIFLQSFVQSY